MADRAKQQVTAMTLRRKAPEELFLPNNLHSNPSGKQSCVCFINEEETEAQSHITGSVDSRLGICAPEFAFFSPLYHLPKELSQILQESRS